MLRFIGTLAVGVVIVACTGPSLQAFSKHSISFEVSSQLKLEEYTLDLARQIFRKGSSNFDQGVVMSSENNFILEWVYEPTFTAQLARAQVLNGPAFFESTNPSFSASIVGIPQTRHIEGFEVTFAEMEVVFTPGSRAPGIIGVWQCQPSERAIIFIALHKQPTSELERFVKSFSCQ